LKLDWGAVDLKMKLKNFELKNLTLKLLKFSIHGGGKNIVLRNI
jgi:hypothetical protein